MNTEYQKNGLRLVKQRKIDSLLHKYEGKFIADQIRHEQILLHYAQVASLNREVIKEIISTKAEEKARTEHATQRINGIYNNFIKALDEKRSKKK